MRLAKTSVVYFISDVVTSIVGFLATVYFARVLGASVLGKYYVIIALVAWLSIPTNGVTTAIAKRMSEEIEQGEFLTAGFLLNGFLAIAITVTVITFRGHLNTYIGLEIALFVLLVFLGNIGFLSITGSLKGQHLVTYSGLLKTFDRIVRVTAQLLFVALGYSVIALVSGHVIGLVLAVAAGLLLSRVEFALPRLSHLQGIASYAKYSWLGNMKGKTFAWMDTLILSLFVSSGLIGIYEVSWRLASVLILVSNAVQQTLFPEMSRVAMEDNTDRMLNLLNEGLFAAGLFVIPGLIGALILGPKILRIYGPEFVKGNVVLIVLITARGIDAYGTQFENLINAFDRPDLMFKVNFLFILTNVTLNLVLINLYGWVGAAIATAVSSLLVIVFGYYYVSKLLGKPDIPVHDIGTEILAGVVMGGFVWLLRALLPWSNMYVTVGLVLTGAFTFIVVLFAISRRFRKKTVGVLPDHIVRVV
ncbi:MULTISPECIES: polysaccharide biosynthesis C-terminal domain-containing protein [Salinibaculum]|uniref:oligosaccharide flippase family protein n=1 Tax=Salinibaculum TaxID=2732368 RepID=UPI0030D1CE4D